MTFDKVLAVVVNIVAVYVALVGLACVVGVFGAVVVRLYSWAVGL